MNSFRQFGESAASAVLERIGRGVSKVQERKPLPYDVLESDDDYLVVFDAPGVESGDVQVRYVDGEVQVRLDRFREYHEGFEMRFPGRGLALSGSARLPDDAAVEPADSSATLTNSGTLHVRLPKDGSVHDVAVTDEAESIETSDETRDAETGDEGTAALDADDRATDDDRDAAGETTDTGTGGADSGAADEDDSVGGAATVDETNTGDLATDDDETDRE